MAIRFPGESESYRVARDRLLEQEIALRRQMEAVAVARRALPPGGLAADYRFDALGPNAEPRALSLSELFAAGKDSLLIYSMMFPRDPGDRRQGARSGSTARLPLVEAPCPSCTALLDQLDGAAEHIAPLANFVVIAKAPIARVVAFAKERGWRRLQFLSSAGNTYNRDYHAETEDGAQRPMLNVFAREASEIRHFWGSELLYAPTDDGQDPRHLGPLEPMWNMLDLTRHGRKRDWDEQLHYGAAHEG